VRSWQWRWSDWWRQRRVTSGEERRKFGKGVTLKEATPLKALFETPEKFVGKTIRIDGVVTAVCAEMGCWMALGESAEARTACA
jgi:hypothetical protein